MDEITMSEQRDRDESAISSRSVKLNEALKSINRQRKALELEHEKAMRKLDRDERDLLGLR